jgi:hypothetical protein
MADPMAINERQALTDGFTYSARYAMNSLGGDAHATAVRDAVAKRATHFAEAPGVSVVSPLLDGEDLPDVPSIDHCGLLRRARIL